VTELERLRGQLAALDDAIIQTITERAKVSKLAQAARNAENPKAGNVDIGQERLVMDRYRSRLGHAAGWLALDVLSLCRADV
jgi:chorismate mutase